jgi:CheY-like chemotaxis protein
VTQAGSAEEALDLLASEGSFDMLITDHLMAGLSGAELVRRARAAFPGMKVLLVSAFADGDGRASGLPRLSKPFRIDELESCLLRLS